MDYDSLLEMADRLKVQSAIYASTAGVDTRLVESLERLLPEGCLVLTHSTPLPMEIDYATPETLGADRIAAAVGARDACQQAHLLVVDAGTCVTLDVVKGNTFTGGNISPGIAMRFKAMHDYSAALPLESADEVPENCFGNSTSTALRCGVLQGIVGEVLLSYRLVAVQSTGSHQLVITGGDAPLLCTLMDELLLPYLRLDHAVMTGLLKILQYNERI